MSSGPRISVADVLRTRTIDELNIAADDYFKHVSKDALFQKPFNDPAESAEIILTLMHVMKGLNLAPGATVLDFGAGSCWSSMILAGFGYRVIASDVSRAALDLGAELMRRRPIFVDHPPITFLHFDGHRLDLPDGSVDAVCCLSAFHHVPNQETILAEMSRVIRPWGRAGFSEPGPTHSSTPQSQKEMQNYCVLENDIIIEDIWEYARTVGFTNLMISLFYPEPVYMPLQDFNSFLAGQPSAAYEHNMRLLMQNRRLYVMEKGAPGVTTSEGREGLDACLVPDTAGLHCATGETLRIGIVAENTGQALWRPSSYQCGPVRLGAAWINEDDSLSYLPRVMLPSRNDYGILPGESVETALTVAAPLKPGRHRLQLQLVSELVAWFGLCAQVVIDVHE